MTSQPGRASLLFLLLSTSSLVVLATASQIVLGAADEPTCKCYPGDDCWPKQEDWDALTEATEGRFAAELPPGLACYNSYEFDIVPGVDDPGTCGDAKAKWNDAEWVADLGAWPMYPFWSNSTCYPSNSPGEGGGAGCASTCQQGFVPKYIIRAEKAEDIQAGVNFAREHNLRLVVRNTGHDFMGRSVGWGSLAINTHAMNSIDVFDMWPGPGGYKGKAVTAGAGVMIKDLYDVVWKLDQDVLAGECPTVGVAGGFIQGGGQGPLSGYYGLASDTALQFTVVLANGEHVTANEEENPDLFWALKGGGPGAFGVVTSVTMKMFDRVYVTGMALNITGEGDTFWEGFKIWHTFAPELVKHGMYVWYSLSPGQLTAQPFVAPNMTNMEFKAIVKPMFDAFDAANVTYSNSEPWMFENFQDIYEKMWYNAYHGAGVPAVVGGRLISLTDMKERGEDIAGAFRAVMEKYDGAATFGGHLVNPGNAVKDPESKISAVHPVWREAADVGLYLYMVDDCLDEDGRQKALDTITYGIGDLIREATPNSAVYVNEGDVNEPNWQDAFWGPVYPSLLKIKEKYDKDDVFWTKATPGSEKWNVVDELKLCKVET